MSLENIFAANAATVAATTKFVSPPTSTEVTTSTLPETTSQRTTHMISSISVSAPAAAQEAMLSTITLTAEQWAAYTSTQNRIAELEAAERRREAEARDTEVKALQAKGQIEAAFNLQREQARLEIEAERKRLKDTEERANRYALDGELTRALAGQPLVPGGAAQLTQLWQRQFAVEAQGDTFAVHAPNFQPVSSWIAAQLGQPEYSHFLRARNPDSSTITGVVPQLAHPPYAQATATDTNPRNLGDAIAQQMRDIAKQTTTDAMRSGGSKLGENGGIIREPAAGFGLRPLQRA
jgi:hypothetical protein